MEDVGDALPEAHGSLKVPEVTWYKHPGLRKLYVMMPILFLGLIPIPLFCALAKA